MLWLQTNNRRRFARGLTLPLVEVERLGNGRWVFWCQDGPRQVGIVEEWIARIVAAPVE